MRYRKNTLIQIKENDVDFDLSALEKLSQDELIDFTNMKTSQGYVSVMQILPKITDLNLIRLGLHLKPEQSTTIFKCDSCDIHGLGCVPKVKIQNGEPKHTNDCIFMLNPNSKIPKLIWNIQYE